MFGKERQVAFKERDVLERKTVGLRKKQITFKEKRCLGWRKRRLSKTVMG